MSIQAMSWVWDHSEASGADLLVFLALADSADAEGEAWPHQEKVAAKSRVSVRSVQRSIDALVRRGELEVRRTGRGNRYKLPMRQSGVIRQSSVVSDTTGVAGQIRHSSVTPDTTTVADARSIHQEPSRTQNGSDASLGKSKANSSDRQQPTWVRPTNFVEDLNDLPEKQVDQTDEERAELRQRIRLLKGGQP